VPTFRRVERLERLLPELVKQAALIGARVLVIDNDPDADARATVTGWAARGVGYAHEPRPGISAARNRGIDESADADALVFIDDDEMPAPGWLAALVDEWLRRHCDAVTGPVTAVYPSTVDPWVLAAGVLDQPARMTGARMHSVAANNLLLDIARIRELGMRFDERFGLTGGEDTMFGHTLARRGGDIRWCAEAVVVDQVPAQRATRSWMLRRTYRAATSWSRVRLLLAEDGSPRTAGIAGQRASLLTRGVVRSAVGATQMVRGVLLRGLRDRARGRVTIVSGGGMLLGALGARPEEYGRVASSAGAPRSGPRPGGIRAPR
jgi:hypothetical protein